MTRLFSAVQKKRIGKIARLSILMVVVFVFAFFLIYDALAQTFSDLSVTDVKAEAISASQARIAWKDDFWGEDGFLIERKGGDNEDFVQVAQLEKDTTFYQNESLDADTEYVYRVRAYRPDEFTQYSSEVSIRTYPESYIGGAPSSFHIQLDTVHNAVLSWKDNSEFEDGFLIERKKKMGFYQEVFGTEPGVTEYRDEGLGFNSTYIYRVRAYKERGEGQENDYTEYASEASVSTGAKSELSVCGNSLIEEGERCDDGNTISEDGCSEVCRLEDITFADIVRDVFAHVQYPLLFFVGMGIMAGLVLAAFAFSRPFVILAPISLGHFVTYYISNFVRCKHAEDGQYDGIVFDRNTRSPLSNVDIMLLNDNGNVIEKVESDICGKFTFKKREGIYKFRIEKKEYEYCQELSHDFLYGDVVQGSVLTLGEEKLFISLVPKEWEWTVFIHDTVQRYISRKTTVYRYVFEMLFVTGCFSAVILLLISMSIWYAAVTGVYIFIAGYVTFIKKIYFGTLEHRALRTPVSFAVLFLYAKDDPETRVSHTVTNIVGQYRLHAPSGEYILRIRGKTHRGEYFQRTRNIKITRGVFKENIHL